MRNTLARPTFALLMLTVAGTNLAPVAAQVRPKKKSATTTAANLPATAVDPSSANLTQAVHPDVMTVHGAPDLIIRRLGFTGIGDITFELRNRGDVPINPAPAPSAELSARPKRAAVTPVPEAQQIKVMVYFNNAPTGTVFQPRLAGQQSKTFTVAVPPNLKPKCAGTVPLRTVIDPGNVIPEYTDTNNVDTVTAARPCPDLAIKSITKNTNKWKTEFVARVTIINQGNAPVDKFDYLAKEWFGGSIADLGDLDDDVGGPLKPGETMKFNVGSARAHQNLHVEVLLDRHRRVEELDENNNYKKKTVN